MNIDSEILLQTYNLADMLNQSQAAIDYLKYKSLVEEDVEVKRLKKNLRDAKLLYEETERFGKFHPDYNEAKIKIDKVLAEINSHELIKQFKRAEEELNQLFYSVSNTLAGSISKSIKVPRNDNLLDEPFCSTGSCTSCGLKGSCLI